MFMKFKHMTQVWKSHHFMNVGNNIGKETLNNVGTGCIKLSD